MNTKRRWKRPDKRQIIKISAVVAGILVLMVCVVFFLQKRVREQYGSSEDREVLSAEVSTGSISTTVYGTGQLKDDNTETITIPDGVELTELKVSAGDSVEEGDELSSVDISTVLTAMASVQTEIDALDEQLEDASDEEAPDTIKASIDGRVKKIYAEKNESVSSVMYENGALMILSLDGKMAVDVETEALTAGEDVTVTDSGGTSYSGEVSKVSGSRATVLLADNGPEYGDTVSVSGSDGTEAGTGTLYVNDPLRIVSYAGTIEKIRVTENESVSAGETLITLTDTSYTGTYDSLLKEREGLPHLPEAGSSN